MLELFRKYLSFVLPTSSISAFFCTTKHQLARILWKKIPRVGTSFKLKHPMFCVLVCEGEGFFSDITGRCCCGYHDNKASCWLEINYSR
ncbi:hypothetical protein NQ317_017478 [Molorchus minor]|uniref:Secreted protein n=1 Tax=Molorchus minor TaxID=1323400 RepID=A0ABQ9JSJ3_9CUCU|nr:hypothetical protein NQ317_017478 [Molorchus minor]